MSVKAVVVPIASLPDEPRVHAITSDREAIDIARAFAAELAPGASERDRQRRAPREELAKLAKTGLLGLIVPKSHGGPAVSTETLVEVFSLLAAGDPAVAQVPQNHYVFLDIIRRLGTDSQKSFFFGEVLGGARFGNALSERGTKHVMDMKTRLTRGKDGEYRLNGTKYYCTGALTAQYVPVFALDDDNNLVAAYADRHAPGLVVGEDWTAMGQRATISGTTTLNDVPVAGDRIVPLSKDFGRPQTGGAFGQIIHAAIDVGIARNALEDGARFVKTLSRPWFESGLDHASDEQMLLHRFGELTVKVIASEELLRRAGRLLDAAQANLTVETAAEASLAVAAAKAFGGDVSVEVSGEIFALAGTRATDEQYNLNRHWRNARTHTLHDPNRWKYFHLGNALVNGTPPPNHGLI